MHEFLTDLATENEWQFEYSRHDYQNVSELATDLNNELIVDKVYLFVEPIEIESKFSETGFETKSYSGNLMFMLSSDFDESYSDKYTRYIKPLMDDAVSILKRKLNCASFDINRFKTIEIINFFDHNLDGVAITYNVTYIA